MRFGSSDAAATFVDSSTLTAVAPKAKNGATVEVRVTSGGQSAAATTYFKYALPHPANVVAVATSATTIQVTWSAVPTATQYEITLRNPNRTFTAVGTSATTTFIHGSRSPDTAYVYRVIAIDGDGNRSAMSLADGATTTRFTNAAIPQGMRIKAAHVVELRQAVNAMRTTAGVPAPPFTDTISTTMTIRKTHIVELRTAIEAARLALGMSTTPFTDPDLASLPVRAIHVQELLNAVR